MEKMTETTGVTAAVPSFPASTASPLAEVSSAVAPEVEERKGSKSKSNQPNVAMATGATATSSNSGIENTGRWTTEEHQLFLKGLKLYGKGWKKIASLIKSRTVVQTRTHAQKYFQKLAKARQDEEKSGVAMEGREPVGARRVGGTGAGIDPDGAKRRRQTNSTKRKAISSVGASAQREGKKLAAATTAEQRGQPAPVGNAGGLEIATYTLEDSLFSFLNSVAPLSPQQVNTVARQAGANPIILPSNNPKAAPENSPTGVSEVSAFPALPESKNPPAWYAAGADVDELLKDSDILDWLPDFGDVNEVSKEPVHSPAPVASPLAPLPLSNDVASLTDSGAFSLPPATPVAPSKPQLFESSDTLSQEQELSSKKVKLSAPVAADASQLEGASGNADENFSVFDVHFDEQAFVSDLLENSGGA